jgi:acetoin utilization deacetylase AcuC-like enzyme
MTLLYYDPRFLAHDTGNHPERAERLRQINARLESTRLMAECTRPSWEPVSRARLQLVHEPGHIDNVAAMAARGGGHPDPDTVVSPASFEVAQLATGAACDAVDRVLAGEDKTALCGRRDIMRCPSARWVFVCLATSRLPPRLRATNIS